MMAGADAPKNDPAVVVASRIEDLYPLRAKLETVWTGEALMDVVVDDPAGAHVEQLLRDHLADMFATSPAESVHALDVDALAHPDVTFFTAMENGSTLGCGALKQLSAHEGEIKSMRTTEVARGRGVASVILERILLEARARGYASLSLETGPQDFFAPARRLYARYGFVECEPFGDYTHDPYSVYMSLDLEFSPPART